MSTAAPSARERARRRAPWWLWTLVVVATVVGAVALLGGFSDVPDRELPVVAEGDTHVGGQFETTIERIYLSDARPGSDFDSSDDTGFVVVEATVENTTELPSTFVGRLVRVIVGGSIGETDAPSLIEARTGDPLTFAQPGLPVTAWFVWEVDDGEIGVGDRVFLGFFEQFPIYGDPVFGDDAFGAPTATARMETSVGPAPRGGTP
jgi:hypothetical protein